MLQQIFELFAKLISTDPCLLFRREKENSQKQTAVKDLWFCNRNIGNLQRFTKTAGKTENISIISSIILVFAKVNYL